MEYNITRHRKAYERDGSTRPQPFDLIEHVNDIVTVNDDAIVEAMGLIFQRLKLVVEPSAAVPLAAVLADKVDVDQCRVGIVLSGGNTDLDKLPW